MIQFTGLVTVLKKFDENGRYAQCGKWSIANGGYDLWWEIYYDGNTVLQCIDGELEGDFRPFPEFTEEVKRKLIKKVKAVYTHLK